MVKKLVFRKLKNFLLVIGTTGPSKLQMKFKLAKVLIVETF